MTTNTATVSTVVEQPTLSENDREILTRAFTSLHSVLKGYKVGKSVIPDHINLNDGDMCCNVLQAALDAHKSHLRAERKARYAKVRAELTLALEPHLIAQRAAREALLALPAAALDMVRKSGALKDTARVPFAYIIPVFPTGTTMEQIKDLCEKFGYKVARGADKGTLDLIVALVAPEPLVQPANAHQNPAPHIRREETTSTDA